MKFVMVEKVVTGYDNFLDVICYKNEFGDFHREKGPAIIDPDGVLSWYYEGKFIKSVNVEDDDIQIENIINGFNFSIMHLVMTFMSCEYHYLDGSRVPTQEELKEQALALLRGCKKYRMYNYPEYISSGGFTASASKQGFELKFVVEQFSTT